MSDNIAILPELIDCPLCIGKGQLSRTEILERLGMKDYTRVAQLSAEEAIRLIVNKEKESEQARWVRFESELTKRVTDVSDKYKAQLQKLDGEKTEIALRLKELEKNSGVVLDNAKVQERLATEKKLQQDLNALTKRINELENAQSVAEEKKKAEVATIKADLEGALNTEKSKANDLDRRVKDYLEEITKLRDRNQTLETEMAKVARVGKKEEIDFAEEVGNWPGIWIGDKLSRNGDYLIAFCDATGNPLDPTMVVDNKDKSAITEGDIKKLIRDAKERSLAVSVIVTRDETQLRQADRLCRWGQEDGIWMLRTTREWLRRDLEVLRPVFERMRVEGADYLQRNAALGEEVRRTFVDIDEIEKQLKKAGTAIETAQTLTAKYRGRLSGLCDTATASLKMPSQSETTTASANAGVGD
jgi:hypothetical protein